MKLTKAKQYEIEFSETYEEVQTRIWEKASPDLREEIAWIQNWFDNNVKQSLRSHWELGTRCRRIANLQKPGRPEYGYHAIKDISKYFAWSEGTIYNAMKFAETYSEEELNKLIDTQLSDRSHVTYSHLLVVLPIDNPDVRKELISRTISEEWTVEELAREAYPQLRRNKPIGDRRGRPLAAPRTFDSVACQMESFTEDFIRRADSVWQHTSHSLENKLYELGPDDFTKERLDRLKDVSTKLGLLADRANALKKSVEEVREEFAARLKERPLRLIGHGDQQ